MTATVTATSADDGCVGWVIGGVGRAEDAAEGLDGLALEAESYVGVDAGGDADVGVAEEFLDDDEVDALFQEQGGGRVPEVVEADRPEFRAVEEAAEAAGEVGGVERLALRGGEDESVVRPARSGRLAFFLLPFLMGLEGAEALGGEGDAPLGGQGLGVQDGQALAAGALEGAMDARGAAVKVEVFPVEAEKFALPESGAQGEFVQGVEPVAVGRVEQSLGFGGGEGLEAPGRGVVVLTFRATLRGSSSSRTACSRADLSTAWTYVTVSGESRFPQHWPMAQQDRRTESRSRAQHWQVVRSPSRKVRTSRVVSRASFLAPIPGLRWRRMEAA